MNDHDQSNKQVTTQEFKKLNFAARLAQAKLANKDGIADFGKEKTYFDHKLKNLNNKVTSNKKNILKLKLNQMIQKKKSKIICKTGLAADLINKYS